MALRALKGPCEAFTGLIRPLRALRETTNTQKIQRTPKHQNIRQQIENFKLEGAESQKHLKTRKSETQNMENGKTQKRLTRLKNRL